LKQVKIAAIDYGHAHGGTNQGLGGVEAGKSASDDDDMGKGLHTESFAVGGEGGVSL
jgi:hypothetical protein